MWVMDNVSVGQSISDAFSVLWAIGLSSLAFGLLLAIAGMARRAKFPRRERAFSVVAFILIVGGLSGLGWIRGALPPTEVVFEPVAMAERADRRDVREGLSLQVFRWHYLISPRDRYQGEPLVVVLTRRVMQRVQQYRFGRWLVERVLRRLPFYLSDTRVSSRVRLQAPLNAVKSSGGRVAVTRGDLATVTLSSALESEGRVHIWPTVGFRLDCLAGQEFAAIRPTSTWIEDENLQEHETFTLPSACTSGDRVVVDVALGREGVLQDYARLSIQMVSTIQSWERHGSLVGYIGTNSLAPGDLLPIRISADGPVDLEIARLGATNQIVHRARGLRVTPQPFSSLFSYRDGANWDIAHQLVVPVEWRPGYYAVKLMRGSEVFFVYFLVSHDRKARAVPSTVVLVPTNTWQAYNSWGGGSFYSLAIGALLKERQAHVISLNRPIPLGRPDVRHQGGHLLQPDLEVTAWLDAAGYSFTVLTDSDLHAHPELLRGYRLVVIPSHSEYWSNEMVGALTRHLDSGGSLAYLGGNALYQRVTIRDGLMEGYNHRQFHELDGALGGFFYLLQRPQSRVLGVQYDAIGYNTFAPYIVKAANHWAFKGTGLKAGDQFGVAMVKGTRYFASGHETDKVNSSSPANLTILATGANDKRGADMTIYEHPGGGIVYAVGSIAYPSTLNFDKRQQRVLSNIVARTLKN